MKQLLIGDKSNDKDTLEKVITELSAYEQKKYKIIRLPEKEQWHVYSGPEWIYEIVENEAFKQIKKKDIVCPDCKGMLEDIEYSEHLYCPACNIEWRV